MFVAIGLPATSAQSVHLDNGKRLMAFGMARLTDRLINIEFRVGKALGAPRHSWRTTDLLSLTQRGAAQTLGR